MKGNWTQFLRQLINEELDEMAKSGRVSKNIIVVDKDKVNRLKKLHAGTWIEEMFDALEEAGENGLSRLEIASTVDKNDMLIRPKIKSLIQIGALSDGEYSKPIKSTSKPKPTEEPSSEKASSEEPSQEDIDALGADFFDWLNTLPKVRKQNRG
jgi:hypothetical protein